MSGIESTGPGPRGGTEAVFSAERIALLLASPTKPPVVPTPEQRAVIEHRLAGSTLVIAGAGSGKTETMANRVVWLVANGLAAPDEILGLTFTRKAAGELRERITGRLAGFAARLRDADERGELSHTESARAAQVIELLADGLDIPEVNTYNSFAAGVLQEFGVAAGAAPGSVVIDEATAWRIAREVVLESDDAALASSDLGIAQLVRHVLNVDHAVADHLSSLDRVDQIVGEFVGVQRLPYNEKTPLDSGKLYAPVRDAVASLAETPLITRLARAYAEEKRRRGLVEFSDQLALATRSLERSADGVRLLRRRHRAVLLDEVQDTSVGQTRFLAMIFAGAPVMAVGDPHQSIYGWRGASAEGLQSFHADFGGRAPEDSPRASATLTLSTSWRNPARVLDAANAISGPLAADAAVDVPQLVPRPGAGAGSVEWTFPETVHEERLAVAEWMRAAREAHLAEHGEQPSAAVIFRKRSPMAAFSAALTEAGVPNRIVGLGGLLSTPEITDVVSVLRCLWYADAGGPLLRLLSGPRFRLGVADLGGLREAARWFAERDIAQQPIGDAQRSADSVLPDPDRQYTLIDALDQIASMRDLDHRALRGISETGRIRLREAGRMLAALRQGVGGSVGELIGATVQALRLDIELDANEARETAGTSAAHANLDVFADLVDGYLAVDSRGTLASLLEWIERATEADEAAEHVAAPQPGTVQLITAHGAKGLEWDLVAVPRLVGGEFPGTPRIGAGWLRAGELPDELRGDARARPQLKWRLASTQKELCDRLAEYKEELRERHREEERRLAYVAVTRAAERLLLSGSFWGGQTRPRPPSPYLLELQEAGIITGVPEASAHEADPSERAELTMQWPPDPLGARGPAVLRAAATLRAALATRAPDDDWAEDPELDETVRLLLAERRAAQQSRDRGLPAGAAPAVDVAAALPERVTASTFHEFVEDPERAERRRLRPVPQRPYRRTRLGNRFHEWVERRATTARGTALPLSGLELDVPDPELAEFDGAEGTAGGTPGSPGSANTAAENLGPDDEAALRPLIEQFERSRWAELQPIAVEQEVTLPFAGRTLVCKLDAVYRVPAQPDTPGASHERYEVVDWKAGRSPRNEQERQSRFFQLDLYRHAYAQWAGVDPARIDVSLYYVSEGVELRGGELRELDALERIWRDAAARLGGAAL
ncbi:ATP-dependent DNA helicase [Leucobacter triazinivorans]|uniref:DNA 3'-5' helicase n=1 Tax=Leucobacter triazinivorans TaxID=1784719 RepID=A0A4P6KBU1_9MICO|nr:ATP-dependent DNA helicase [Leucobacter triazinivorans]QBE47766.1 ATP-dependent helicase [Leucobacter triazinivorans]